MKNCTVVARSTCPSQNVQNNTSASEHFWKSRCPKSARRGGANRISKSKVLKTDGFGALFEVEMLKKYTALWHEAHIDILKRKCLKALEAEVLKNCTPL